MNTAPVLDGKTLTHYMAGWYSPQTASADPAQTLNAMLQGAASTLPAATHAAAHTACASTDTDITRDGGCIVTLVGSPSWGRPDLAETSSKSGHTAALTQAYLESGADCIQFMQGPFSFGIIDVEKKSVLLATDRMGRCPVYYAPIGDGVVFGSSASIVLAHDAIKRSLRPQGLYDYVYFHMVPSPHSIYENVDKLPAGHLLQLSDGKRTVTPWFKPKFSEQSNHGMSELGQELRTELRNAVKRANQTGGKIAAFLSGGLDSSSVAGMLAETSEKDAHAYSIGFSAEGYDEMEYARLTARHFGIKLHEYYVTPEDVVEALPQIAASYDEPFGNSSALPAYFCAKFAANDGVDCLLAGDGGDELFAGNERYLKQGIFENYNRIPGILRSALIEPIVKHLPEAIKFSNKARSYVEQANTPLPARLQSYNFLHRHAASEVFCDSYLAHADPGIPLGLLNHTYQLPKKASVLNRMLYLDWQNILADNDLRKVGHMCALAGVDVLYPMLDDRLIELSCQVPSSMKMKRGKLRHFYKESMRGWLPEETIKKPKQGFGLPFGVWMKSHVPLQELAYDNLIALKSRQIFRPKFIDQTIELHRNQHSAYYGELVWILMVLELWMGAHTELTSREKLDE